MNHYWEIHVNLYRHNFIRLIVIAKSGNLQKFKKLNCGQVAQLVEQRPEKPCVAGSIPALSTGNKQNNKFSEF